MIPRAFEYIDPTSTEETVNLLSKYGEDAKLMAGGMSLLPMMKLRIVSPRVLVDLWRVPDLEHIRERDGMVLIGSRVTHYALHSSEIVRKKIPVLAEAAQVVGDPLVRNLGTIGGSAAHAAPNADYPPVLVALAAEMSVTGPKGTRTIGAKDFFKDIFTTAMEPSEVLTEIRIPFPKAGEGGAYLKMSRRGTDFAVVSVAAVLRRGGGGCCGEANLLLGGVGSIPVRARAAEELLQGASVTPELVREASEAAVKGLEPPSDVQADSQYRIDVAKVFVRRAIEAAWSRIS
jgi:carbon-monoxide dehydrogenase medium subunit